MQKDEQLPTLHFGAYKITGATGQILRRSRPLALSPKAVAVLWALAQRAGQVVSKEELFAAVWPETIVSEGVLTNCIHELRQALGETTAKPRYLETVPRRGYRFIAPVAASATPVQGSTFKVQSSLPPTTSNTGREEQVSSQPGTWNWEPGTRLVGREAELAQLHSLFAKAANGERQVVFVTGEAGIGKTALVDTFVQSLGSRVQGQAEESQKSKVKTQKAKVRALSPQASSLKPLAPPVSFAHGQCIEHYGTGEAYLPVLAALSQLCRQDEGEQVVRVLRRVAPTWLLQLPALLSEDEYTALQQKLAGATQERMLRELVEALEVLSAERPVVLVLEDVHWSDGSTIDLLNLLARQREVTRVLVLATCRPTELVVTNHPLKQVKHELVTRGLAAEVVLGGLPAEAVQHYVGQRMTVPGEEETVAAFVYQRSEGHPLFMVQMTDYLLQQHGQRAGAATALSVIDQEVPQGLRELIETQIGRLTPDEQQVLEVGSVAGAEFTVASVAAGLQTTGDAIEGICETLARRGQFIVDQGITRWPDGTASGQYGFRHAMYQEVLYQRLGSGRRSRMHYLIGLCEEARYGEQANEGAAELAMHFERGQDYPRAVAYCCQAAERALHQNAAREGLAHLTNGVTLLARMPESQARLRQEVLLHSTLGLPLFRTTGYTAPAVEQAYHRAQALYRQLQETPESFPACLRFWHFTLLRVDLPTAREVAERLVTIAQQAADPDLESLAAYVQGTTAYHRGEWSQVRDSLLRGLETYKIHHDRATILFLSEDRGVASYCHLAIVSWGLGYAAQAQQHIDAALQLAHTLERSLSVVRVWSFAASLAQLRQDWSQLQVIAMTILEMAREHGWLIWRIVGSLGHGRALVGLGRATEGLEEIRQALSTYQTWGAVQMLPHFLSILLEAQLASGQVTDGLATVDEALTVADKTGERWNVAELWRLKGELTLAQSGVLGPASGVQTQEENEKSKVKSQKSKIPNTQHLTPSTQGVVQEAEEYFLKALAIARQQHAKSLELRAVMSLVRLRQQQALEQGARSKERGVGSKELGVSSEEQGSHARLADAHKLLSDVYGWFTEGFDTKDLQEAKALLGDLEEKAKRGKG